LYGSIVGVKRERDMQEKRASKFKFEYLVNNNFV
jgi:hypothetical protein